MKVPIINVSYKDILCHCEALIKYLFENGDKFSLITLMERSHLIIPSHYKCSSVINELKGCLVNQLVGIRRWNNTETNQNIGIMNVYKCCEATEEFMRNNLDVIIDPIGKFPEDICFYKKNSAWFSTVSHESLAFIFNPTYSDIQFLIKHHIGFSPGGKVDNFTIQKAAQKIRAILPVDSD